MANQDPIIKEIFALDGQLKVVEESERQKEGESYRSNLEEIREIRYALMKLLPGQNMRIEQIDRDFEVLKNRIECILRLVSNSHQ